MYLAPVYPAWGISPSQPKISTYVDIGDFTNIIDVRPRILTSVKDRTPWIDCVDTVVDPGLNIDNAIHSLGIEKEWGETELLDSRSTMKSRLDTLCIAIWASPTIQSQRRKTSEPRFLPLSQTLLICHISTYTTLDQQGLVLFAKENEEIVHKRY